ncbi:unnamed protein product [Lupinus luteus]|uniref:Uncharacterized protein n=1 Tax=Lupinus luteus TaxID=3873 RepID=A0AAV1WRE2_LUPLU
MFTSSHQRIPRSNGFKVKHALQICIVLGVCVWLIYEVGHSGEDTKTVGEAAKLSRKDLHSHADESSVLDTRHREEEGEEESRHEEQNKLDDTNGVEDEIVMQKRDENNNEENYERRQGSVDQENEGSTENSTRDNETEEHNQYSSEENDNTANKENEQNINEVEDKESSQISEEKSRQENEETRDTSTENKENEEINQDRDEVKEHGEVNHEQDSKKDKEESNATENEREDNDKIQEVASSEDLAQDGEGNNEVPRDEHYTSTNASNALDNKYQDTSDGGFNKTEQSDKKEKNEFELESHTNATEAAHVDQKESVSNVTESETTEVANSNVITTKQRNSSQDQAETQNDSQKSFIADSNEQQQEHNNFSGDGVETLHLQNGTDTTSITTEKQIETSEKSISEVGESTSSLNNTMLKAEDSSSDTTREQASPTLTDSSGVHESNVTNVQYRDTSGNSAQTEIPNNYSIQEAIPEHALSPNTNSNKDASQEVQFASSNTSSELKSDESFNFENSTSSGQSETVNYVQSNTNSGGSANNNTENNGNENANGSGNDSNYVPLNATDFSISEEKDESLKNNVDVGQVENEKTVQNKTNENEEGWQNESVESQKEKEESTHLDGHSKSKLNDQGSSEPSNL